MATTYTLISSVTVGSGGASTIGFSSIPSTYTDLVVRLSLRTNATNGYFIEQIYMQFNNDTTMGRYSFRNLSSDGSTPTSDATSSGDKFYVDFAPCATATSNTFSNSEIYIPNYAGSNQKSVSTNRTGENNNTQSYMGFQASLYNQTTAISSIQITPNQGNNYVQYSTAYLYGISNA